ncbi:MAG TPA: ArsR family transcriptional regulator [Desulfuromonas sp.]|nr:ArsR family transcriptional regulator [Desulfuromonas sp.]
MPLLILLKALSDENRLRLVAVLARGEFTVQELTAILVQGQSRISHHLKSLSEAGVVTVKRQGTWGYYRLDAGNPLFAALRPLLERSFTELPAHAGDVVRLAKVLEERQRKSRAFFDQHARQWDELALRLLPLPDYRQRLLALLPERTVLVEIGSGTGALLGALSRRSDQLIAIDHSPAMLELARQRVANEGLTNVELRLGEMSHLPLADGLTGGVVLNMVLHHAADPLAVLKEVRRVLAPGGVLVLADVARHEREAARDELADQWLGFEVEELNNWLTLAGFSAIRCEQLAAAAGEESVLLLRASRI